MNIYQNRFAIFGLAILFTLPLAATAQIPKAHRHRGQSESMVAEINRDFSISEAVIEKDAEIENKIRNKSGTFEAFTVGGARIFYKNLKSGKIFEIKGLPFEWRDFSDLAWADNQTLMFDRWVQPHYATHYAVSVLQKKLLDAAPFPDEFMLKQKPGIVRKREND